MLRIGSLLACLLGASLVLPGLLHVPLAGPAHAQAATNNSEPKKPELNPDPSLSSVWTPRTNATATEGPHRSRDRVRTPGSWSITDKQWDLFRASAVAAKLSLHVAVRLNSLRSKDFKDDLVELLSSIPGWDVDDQGTYTAGTLPTFIGISIQNRGALYPSAPARAIMAAFVAAGIQPTPVYEAWEPDEIRIVVGSPPD